MIDLDHDNPLKRGIPNTPFFLELKGSFVTLRVRGSRRPGVTVPWASVLEIADYPKTAPAKITNATDYLRWVNMKVERRKEKKDET